jgi:predicted DCC family thiol-disulfide oxidoreductase YuxK
MDKTKVYYNSACPVCNAGIKSQRQRMQVCGVTGVEWIDIHSQPDAVQEVDASLEQVRERLYVRGNDGNLRVGAEAFAELFSVTPGQRLLGRLLRLPVIRTMARGAYNVFARCLYRWNRVCKRW